MAILENQGTRMETTPAQYEPVRQPPPREREAEKTTEVVGGGAGIQALLGAAAVVLVILGLAKMWPERMAAIALILGGAGLLFLSGAASSRARHLIYAYGAGDLGRAELGSGLGSEFLGGAAAVVLGILALLDVRPLTLMPVGLIALGGAVLLGAMATARMSDLAISHSTAHPTAQSIAHESVSAAAGLQSLIGVGAIVLGILALLGYSPLLMTLIGTLSVGGALLISGGVLSGAIFGTRRR